MRLLSCIVVGGTREHLCNGLGRSGQLRISLITQMCRGRTLRALSCWCLVQPSVNLTFQHLVMVYSVHLCEVYKRGVLLKMTRLIKRHLI